MKIGIDASRYVEEGATGVEWYSKHIIDGIIAELAGTEHELLLYSREKLKIGGDFSNKVLPAKRLWTLWTLSREMKKNPPDVLFVPSHTLPLRLPKKSVIMIHDTAFRHLREAYSFFQYHYLNWSTKFAVKRASKIIVPSEATADDLVKLFKCPRDKIIVVQHGFSPPEFSESEIDECFESSDVFELYGINKDLPYLFFVGRLESKKNLERLIKAFAKVVDDFPDHRLVLAGKRGVGFDKILKTVKELGLLDQVMMPGYVDEKEKAALYRNCEIFAFPSLYEGFGLPVLEAFHYKKPVFTSDCSSMPEVGGEAVDYVNPKDTDDIYKVMKKLLKDGEHAKSLVSKGSERLKFFSWKAAARKTLDILTS